MYGHAALLTMTCANDGCPRLPYCTSDVDGRLICVHCAMAEEGSSSVRILWKEKP